MHVLGKGHCVGKAVLCLARQQLRRDFSGVQHSSQGEAFNVHMQPPNPAVAALAVSIVQQLCCSGLSSDVYLSLVMWVQQQ
jgi:hypothetical protein